MEVFIDSIDEQQARLLISALQSKLSSKNIDQVQAEDLVIDSSTQACTSQEGQQKLDCRGNAELPVKGLSSQVAKFSKSGASQPKYFYQELFTSKPKNGKSTEGHSYCHVSI